MIPATISVTVRIIRQLFKSSFMKGLSHRILYCDETVCFRPRSRISKYDPQSF